MYLDYNGWNLLLSSSCCIASVQAAHTDIYILKPKFTRTGVRDYFIVKVHLPLFAVRWGLKGWTPTKVETRFMRVVMGDTSDYYYCETLWVINLVPPMCFTLLWYVTPWYLTLGTPMYLIQGQWGLYEVGSMIRFRPQLYTPVLDYHLLVMLCPLYSLDLDICISCFVFCFLSCVDEN